MLELSELASHAVMQTDSKWTEVLWAICKETLICAMQPTPAEIRGKYEDGFIIRTVGVV